MTDLIHPEDDSSSQSSGSSSTKSQTFSIDETKDKKAQSPRSKYPTISLKKKTS